MNEDRTDKDLLENIVLSTENALKALLSFEHSLVKGHFKESIGPYSVMCKTLVGQRIWSKDKNNQEIDANFRKISEVANNIVNILKPYLESIEKLKIGEFEGACRVNQIKITEEINGGSVLSDEQKILNIIQNQRGKQISYTNLKAALGWNRKQLDEALKALHENSKFLTLNISGSRKIISFR
jgi:Holliday junction resolvasome RuvABC ATP-dependent DNA helicase subunit